MSAIVPMIRSIVGSVEYVGKLATTLATTLYYLIRLAVEWPLTIFQMSVMGMNSIPIVFLVIGFTGMMLSLQITEQAVRFGTKQFVGVAVALVMVRELSPVLTAVVMAGRVGSSIASELGTMKVSEQVDALRSLGTNPVQYLVVPRMLALLIMIPVVSILAAMEGIMAGYWIANAVGHIEWQVYFSLIPKYLSTADMIASIVKSCFFAVTVALIGCVEGMNTEGGAFGVGRATTNAVVIAIVAIFGMNYILSLFLF